MGHEVRGRVNSDEHVLIPDVDRVLVVALLAQRHIVSGLTFGAVKQ